MECKGAGNKKVTVAGIRSLLSHTCILHVYYMHITYTTEPNPSASLVKWVF